MHLSLPSSRSVVFIALLLKVVTTAYLLKVHWDHTPGYTFGDAPAYLHTAKQIATLGTYSLNNSPEGDPLPYAGRLPGYDVVLAPLFLLFQDARTVAAVAIFLQFLLACISLYYLYRLMLKFVPHGWIPAILLWLYAVNVFTGMYDIKNLTESFSISALIIGLALTLAYRSKRELLFGSLFLLWAYLLRPPVLPICLMAWVYPLLSTRSLRLACTLVPLLLFTLVWSGRNYSQFNRFIPMTSDLHGGYQFKPWQLATFSLVSTWGGDITWWKDDSEIRFFLTDLRTAPESPCSEALELLPTYIYTKHLIPDSLCSLRAQVHEVIKGNSEIEMELVERMEQIEGDFKGEKLLSHWVAAPLRLLKNYISQNGTTYMYLVSFSRLVWYEKGLKFSQFILYWAVFVTGIIGAFFAFSRGNNSARILSLSFFFILLVFPLILRRIEFRYIIHLIPLAYVLSGYCLLIITGFLKTRFPFLQHQGSLESKSNS